MMYNKDRQSADDPDFQPARGRLISFEGIDGSGKTAQIIRLTNLLQVMGIHVLVLREPGGTPIGEAIRKILLDNKHTEMCFETEMLLFTAARAQLVRQVIAPALAEGTWIICDRFFDSTLAYQGYGRGMDLDSVRWLNHLAVGSYLPDISFVLDLPVALAIERLAGRPEKADRLDLESRAFMEKAREGFRNLAAAEPDRLVLVDASQPEEILAKQIQNVLREGLAI